MPLTTENFVINIGPVHMSTHGVFRMRAVLDGEVIVDLEPVFGYLRYYSTDRPYGLYIFHDQ
jgi:NADH-quinone oxidoreductase subunit D